MSTENNKEIVVNFYTTFLSDKADRAFAMMDENASWTVMGKSGTEAQLNTMSKAQFIELIKAVGALFPNGLRATIKGITAEGDRVALESESYGETTSGKIYNNTYHTLFEIRDGKIQAVREYCDTLHVHDVFGG